jgi:cellobiose dehydrogenase (acceptor)
VVDINTKVYGTDNLFVVDASIFPGMPSTNPSSLIVIAGEHASEKILALAATSPGGQYVQCGGATWNGPFSCKAPYTCKWQNAYYSQVSCCCFHLSIILLFLSGAAMIDTVN